jgi:formylglycine-generating enzyme required for sulfatase activity
MTASGTMDRVHQHDWDFKVLDEHPPLDGSMQLTAMRRIAATGLPWRVRDRKTGIVMILCAPDALVIGSAATEYGHQEDETILAVNIASPYYLGQTAVTQEEWERVMGGNPSVFQGRLNPVDNVSAWDCLEFARRCGPGFRFPYEAEWENACRAGSTTPFSCEGMIDPSLVNYHGEHPYSGGVLGLNRRGPVPVAALPPNRWYFYEMHGNVWEWCSASTTRRAFAGDRPIPTVLRGGSWGNHAHSCRSASRLVRIPEYRRKTVGFRIARDAPPVRRSPG